MPWSIPSQKPQDVLESNLRLLSASVFHLPRAFGDPPAFWFWAIKTLHPLCSALFSQSPPWGETAAGQILLYAEIKLALIWPTIRVGGLYFFFRGINRGSIADSMVCAHWPAAFPTFRLLLHCLHMAKRSSWVWEGNSCLMLEEAQGAISSFLWPWSTSEDLNHCRNINVTQNKCHWQCQGIRMWLRSQPNAYKQATLISAPCLSCDCIWGTMPGTEEALRAL